MIREVKDISEIARLFEKEALRKFILEHQRQEGELCLRVFEVEDWPFDKVKTAYIFNKDPLHQETSELIDYWFKSGIKNYVVNISGGITPEERVDVLVLLGFSKRKSRHLAEQPYTSPGDNVSWDSASIRTALNG